MSKTLFRLTKTEHGFEVSMTLFRAIRVWFWRCVKHELWSDVSGLWVKYYPVWDGQEGYMQMHGYDICNLANDKLSFRGHCLGGWH